MLSRRHSGVTNLHHFIVAAEVAVIWFCSENFLFKFPTYLPSYFYSLAVGIGVFLASDSGQVEFNAGNAWRVSYLDATRLALRQVVFACAGVFSVVVLFKDPGISRRFILLFFSGVFPLLVVLNRHQLRWVAWRLFFAKDKVKTLFIGRMDRFPDFAQWLEVHRKLGVDPIGHVSYREKSTEFKGVPFLGVFENLEVIMRQNTVNQVVMLDYPDSTEDARHVLRCCLSLGSRLLIHNNFGYKLDYPLQNVRDGYHSYLTLNDEPLEDPVNRLMKRCLDITVSLGVLIVVFPPLALVVWIMQRSQSPGPLFHAQMRTGHNRSNFMILKFRSMSTKNDDLNLQAAENDVRVFPFGRFLRRSSLDEIPQFINVLRGEMSTVGPRPHLLKHSDDFSRDLDVYFLRYFVKPGITGLAQCNGYRGVTSTPDRLRGRVALDLEYIRKWSIWIDIWIIFKTAYQILFPPRTAV